MSHLEDRIRKFPDNTGLHYDRHELSALKWAVSTIHKYYNLEEPQVPFLRDE